MSGSLARLREHFRDPLLSRLGMAMELTPLAEMLMQPVQEALERIEAVASMRPGFDPARDRRHFNICASDNTSMGLLQEVIREVAQLAPGVTIRLLPPNPAGMLDQLRRHQLDIIFNIENMVLSDHPRAVVTVETLRSVVWTGNRRVRDTLTLPLFLELGHVIVRFGEGQWPGFDETALQTLGVQRREEISCPTPLLLGPLVVGTQRVATLPSRLARRQAAILPLKVFQPPVNLPPLNIIMQWNRNRERDGATVWLRDLVLRIAKRKGLTKPPR